MKILKFFKEETVLCIAVILAIISAFITPPDAAYKDYIHFGTLAILFGLMIVIKGLQGIGILDLLTSKMFGNIKNSRKLCMILVLMCFFTAMIMTNDVTLLTFVPIAIITLKKSNLDKYVIPVVVLQTIAANLGSMFMPFGNPHNIYLFTHFNIPTGEFFKGIIPITLAAFLVLWAATFLFFKKEDITFVNEFAKDDSDKQARSADAIKLDSQSPASKKLLLIAYLGLFVVNLLVVFRVLPWPPALIINIVVVILIKKHELLKRVDYALLVTFVGFFIFVGNIGRIPIISDTLERLMQGHEILVSALACQFLNNVPSCILLGGFTDKSMDVLIGCDIGGMGTLIASMASLISFKLYTNSKGASAKKYMLVFTLCNFSMLAILLLICRVIY